MDADTSSTHSELVVVVAPTRRDGEVTCRLLEDAGVQSIACRSTPDVEQAMLTGIGALVLTDIALAEPAMIALLQLIRQQPDWSNLPVLILCRDSFQSPASMLAMQALGNVTILDRPTSTRAMVSAVRAALRGRRWQYRIRDQLVELTHADKALRQSDRRKDEFLATLAHELRNPLAPIKTGLQLLQRTEPSAEQFKRLRDMMERQLLQLVKLIDDLLDVSRIATGKVVLKRERLDLRGIIETAIETCQPLLDAAGHQLKVTLPDHEVVVVGDATRLAQSISNLVNNAAKYTPGGGRIEVTLSDDGDDAVVVVSDTGAGIPHDMLDRVFEMFAQVDRTLERSQGGLGIGLSLVKRLTLLHGGRISVTSAGIGRGSEFTLHLPRISAPPSSGTDRAAAPSAVPTRSLRIMVVDDNRDAADSLAMLLQAQGHHARIEYSGSAALETARSFRPEAVFCDIGMPDVDGLGVAAVLREDPRFASTLLIAVTGWGAEDDIHRSRDAGFDFHLTKPASLEAVKEILARL